MKVCISKPNYDTNKLRAARLGVGWSPATLAEKTNVSVATIRRYERTGKPPFPETVAAIAQALGMEPKDFVSDDTLREERGCI